MHVEIDDIDRRIIAELMDNARRPAKELAQIVGIHPNTLLQRIKRLEREELIRKYTIIPDYDKLGYEMFAIIGIKTETVPGWEGKLKRQVGRHPEIVSFLLVSGDYDAIAIVRCRNKKHMADLLRELQNNEAVGKSITFIVLDSIKASEEYNPFRVK
ncbi:MAG: Lrp/AsnC family transcriptional regulator [Candidatus Micrarchaeota archaeon]